MTDRRPYHHATVEPMTRESVIRGIAITVTRTARGRMTLEEAIETIDAAMPTFEVIAAALDLAQPERASRKKLELALRNCLAMAVRMQRRGVPRHHEQVSIPGDPWTDIVRFCAEAGVVPNILREADDAG